MSQLCFCFMELEILLLIDDQCYDDVAIVFSNESYQKPGYYDWLLTPKYWYKTGSSSGRGDIVISVSKHVQEAFWGKKDIIIILNRKYKVGIF